MILIVGGGVIGLTAACGLAQLGYEVTVVDGKSLLATVDNPDGYDARVYAINPSSQQLFARLGVWPLLNPKRLSAYQAMRVWQQAGNGAMHFDCRELAKPQLGWMLEESVIRNALLQAIAQCDTVHLVDNVVLEDLALADAKVTLVTEQQSYHGQLLIAADGANSWVRSKLKISCSEKAYGHHALVASIAHQKPHQGTAYQRFLTQGPLAFLPLVHPHHSSIVWSAPPEMIEQLKHLEPESFCQRLRQSFENTLGELQLLSPRITFPLLERHIKHYTKDGVLFVGDAAHTIHPLAGLGANLGLSDIACLLQQLSSDYGLSRRSLRAYERERKAANTLAIKTMAGLKALYSPHGMPPLLRGLGMSIVNRALPLKKALINFASQT